MLGAGKKAFEYWINKRLFLLKNSGLHVDNKFVVKGRQYIKCGKDVYIGENSKLLCWDSHRGKKFDKSPEIILGDNLHITRNFVLQCANRIEIGNNVIILGGVQIGEKAIVGAGSVVTHSIPSYSIAVGNPARVIKKYDFDMNEWISLN